MIKRVYNTIKLTWLKLRGKVQEHNITGVQVAELVKRFKDLEYYEVLDDEYATTDLDTLKAIINMMPIKRQKYQANTRDCDDYAWEMRYWLKKMFPKLPVGYLHVLTPDKRKHALNAIVYIASNGRPSLTMVEPMTNEVIFFNYDAYFCII